jgi:CheY-like chemotaxis protein
MLESLGYQVESQTDPLQALKSIKDHSSFYDLVITDKTMPVMTGLRLSEEIKKIDPDLPVILYSGFIQPEELEQAERIGIERVINKPLGLRDLADIAHQVLTQAGLKKHA